LSGLRPLKNGNLRRQQKNPDRLCIADTLRALDLSASLHLAIFERPAQNGNLRWCQQKKSFTIHHSLFTLFPESCAIYASIHRASWIYPLPSISPFLSGLLKTAIFGGVSKKIHSLFTIHYSLCFPSPVQFMLQYTARPGFIRFLASHHF